jgi:predicted metal-dependent hydrolase
MDKRLLLGQRTYTLSDGTSFTAKIYRRSNNRGMSMRVVYGEMELYIASNIKMSDMDSFVYRTLPKLKDRIINRPYMKPGVYAYILGKKRYFTSDVTKKDDPNFFYVPTNVKDPVTRYKAMFLKYLAPRVIEIGKRMGRDVSDWKIRTGLFLTYYAVCFPTKHQFKFDYRLFAYKPEISDSVIIHELAHTYDIHHDDRFYKIVKLYCPDYDELNHMIDCGRFEGRIDDYVF